MYNAPAKVTGNWFPNDERSISTMIGTQANVLGVVLGFLLPGLFVSEYNGEELTPEQTDEYVNEIFHMQLTLAIAGGVVCLLCIFLFEEKPKPIDQDWDELGTVMSRPGGASTRQSRKSARASRATSRVSSREMSMWMQYKMCFTDPVFMLTSIGSSTTIIAIFVFTSVLALLVEGYGLDNSSFNEEMGIVL
jgi:hypothetical protein